MAIWTPFASVYRRFVRVSKTISEPFPNYFRATHSVLRSLPERGSQNFTSISLLPLTTSPLVGCQSTHRTSHPCPKISGPGLVVLLTRKCPLLSCFAVAPDFDQPVIASRDESLIIRTPPYTMACFAMTLETVNIGKMRSEVFNRSRFICRDECLAVMRVLHCTDRVIVDLISR